MPTTLLRCAVPDLRELQDELAKIREVQELLKEMHALGVKRPGYNLASPYDRNSYDPRFDRC
jgi:hypothetical protein